MAAMKQAIRRLLLSLVLVLVPAGVAVPAWAQGNCNLRQLSQSVESLGEERRAAVDEVRRLQAALMQVEIAIDAGDPGVLGDLGNALRDLGTVPGVLAIPLDALDSLFGGDEPDPRLVQLLKDLQQRLRVVIADIASIEADIETVFQMVEDCERGLSPEEVTAILVASFVGGQGSSTELLDNLAETNPRDVSEVVRNPRRAFVDIIVRSYTEARGSSTVATVIDQIFGELLGGQGRNRQRSAIGSIVGESGSEGKTALRVLIDWFNRQRNTARGIDQELAGLDDGVASLGTTISLLRRLLEGSGGTGAGDSLSGGGGSDGGNDDDENEEG